MSVHVLLNAIVDGLEMPQISKGEAWEALRVIENYPTAVGALKTLIEYPDNKEGIKHAQRCIAILEESEARAAAKKAAAAGSPAGRPITRTPSGAAAASSDISDLG